MYELHYIYGLIQKIHDYFVKGKRILLLCQISAMTYICLHFSAIPNSNIEFLYFLLFFHAFTIISFYLLCMCFYYHWYKWFTASDFIVNYSYMDPSMFTSISIDIQSFSCTSTCALVMIFLSVHCVMKAIVLTLVNQIQYWYHAL